MLKKKGDIVKKNAVKIIKDEKKRPNIQNLKDVEESKNEKKTELKEKILAPKTTLEKINRKLIIILGLIFFLILKKIVL